MQEINRTSIRETKPSTHDEILPRLAGDVSRSAMSTWSQWILIVVVAAAALFIGYSTGTLRVPPPVSPQVTPTAVSPRAGISVTPDNRLDKLELEYALLKDALERSIKQYENLLTYFAVIVSLMVGFQAYLSHRQANREQERHDIQSTIEERGVKRVSSILDVLERTLNFRLTTEQEIADFRTNSARINQFLETQQSIIRKQRDAIEKSAKTLATVRRQMFRTVVTDLQAFARAYDTFVQQYADLEESTDTKNEKKEMSARAEYIRGIAAHFSNEPALAGYGKIDPQPVFLSVSHH